MFAFSLNNGITMDNSGAFNTIQLDTLLSLNYINLGDSGYGLISIQMGCNVGFFTACIGLFGHCCRQAILRPILFSGSGIQAILCIVFFRIARFGIEPESLQQKIG